MQQRLRVDGDIFENAPHVDADIFYTDKNRCVFKNIRIRVDEAVVSLSLGGKPKKVFSSFHFHRVFATDPQVNISCIHGKELPIKAG